MILLKAARILPLLILPFILSCGSENNDVKEIKQAYQKYLAAILKKDGVQAVQYIDSKTIGYYEYVLKEVRTSDSAVVNALPVMDKLIVLLIRLHASKEEIASFNGRSTLVYAINKGLTGESAAGTTVDKVVVDGNSARAEFIFNGKRSSLQVEFSKENGSWKINLTSLFDMANTVVKKNIKESGYSENEYLLLSIEDDGEKNLWEPTGQ